MTQNKVIAFSNELQRRRRTFAVASTSRPIFYEFAMEFAGGLFFIRNRGKLLTNSALIGIVTLEENSIGHLNHLRLGTQSFSSLCLWSLLLDGRSQATIRFMFHRGYTIPTST